jgi:uncharacterized damage-inducible protein DinB
MRPTEAEVSPAHFAYIQLVEGDDVLAAIEQQSSATQKLLASLDESRAGYRYAEGKWSVKEVIGHLVDAERILGYRALAIARGDTQPLPGFDEEGYVRHAGFDTWRLGDLSEAYALARRATIVFLRNLPEEAWERRGNANGFEVTVRALAWTIAGHELHHRKTLRERYRL